MEPTPEAPKTQNPPTITPAMQIQPGSANPPQVSIDPTQSKGAVNPQSTDSAQKSKRHRRSKNDNDGRNHRCPECGKCYLSAPALTNHRKTKHDYGKDGEKKGRGRPRKEPVPTNLLELAEEKYKKFFEHNIRKPSPVVEGQDNPNIISSETINKNMQKIFEMCKTELFPTIEKIEDYPFYKLIIDNWDKEKPELGTQCFSAIIKANEQRTIVNTCPLDGALFKYLKDVSNKTNQDYFWFMNKFIITFRECVNQLRANLVKPEDTTEVKKTYTQIYNAETLPDICNDYFMEFMEPHKFFGLNMDELIELIQHFCYWLYKQNFTTSHLTLYDK